MFKEEIEHDTREEFHEFKQDVNQQLATYMRAIKEQNEKISKMETQIDDTDTWSTEANTTLQQMMKDQQKLEDKLNDLVSRAGQRWVSDSVC